MIRLRINYFYFWRSPSIGRTGRLFFILWLILFVFLLTFGIQFWRQNVRDVGKIYTDIIDNKTVLVMLTGVIISP